MREVLKNIFAIIGILAFIGGLVSLVAVKQTTLIKVNR